MLAVYVSGHGYGHSTRTGEVLRAVRAGAPALRIGVVTSAPGFLFEGVAPPLDVRPVECDVGLVQRDALVIDEAGTLDRWRTFMRTWRERVEHEARWLRAHAVRLVVGDIPPLAFAAASEAGVRSVALGNFSWDWVYGHLAVRQPGLEEAAVAAAAAYGLAGLLLRLPFAGDLSAFPRIEDVPLVARRPRVRKGEARRRLGLEGPRPVVLLSFGGAGLPGLRPEVFGLLSEYRFVLTGGGSEGPQPPNLRRLDGGSLAAAGLEYPDLVGAADVVVTKPGYGIVSDCIGASTRLVYTERGDFPEYPIMVGEMGRYLPAVHVSNEDLAAGRLRPAIDDVLGQPWPDPPDLSGAARVADRLLELVADREPASPRNR
jgi:L-arabinokinase